MTPKQSFFRRCLAVLSAALLAAALVIIGTWLPAIATGTHGERGDRDDAKALQIVLITDTGSGLPYPVQGRPFNVVVQAVDDDGKRFKVSQPTKIELVEVSGPGVLGGNTTAVIQADFPSTTIYGATYSQFANGVKFKVKVVYGDDLAPGKITVEVALTAVGANAKPGERLNLNDPNCAAPTSDVPTCGFLRLKKGADGLVTLSVGSCDGLIKVDDLRQCREVGDTEALVVTAIASLKDADGDSLYSRKHPAKVILACDKTLCPTNGDNHKSKIKVIYTLNNTGPLNKVAPPCPKKGVLGKGQEA
ncbi:MAG TPA: hypothetical protein VHQ68_07445, partial [Propionibacteriaceae bacterium]|nr:hypothetical protein [Propionibacteriaceae bacterium]